MDVDSINRKRDAIVCDRTPYISGHNTFLRVLNLNCFMKALEQEALIYHKCAVKASFQKKTLNCVMKQRSKPLCCSLANSLNEEKPMGCEFCAEIAFPCSPGLWVSVKG